MTSDIPEWAQAIPSAPVHQEQPNELTRPFTAQQLIEFGEQLIEQFLRRVVLAVVGSFIPGEGSFEQLEEWAHSIPIIGDIIEIIKDFLNGNLFGRDGFILSNLIPALSFSWITDEQPNLLVAGNFQDGASIADNPFWSWDSGVSHKPDGGGSVKVTANGTLKALRSNEIIVNPAQSMSLEMWVKWSGYTGANSPIKLQLIEFAGRGASAEELAIKDIATLNPNTPNGDWHLMTGSYTVPDGVNAVRVRLFVTNDAQTGTFNFDDGVGKKTNKIQQGWIDGLANSFQEVLSRWQLIIDTVVNGITGSNNALHTLEDLFEAVTHIPLFKILGFGGPGDANTTFEEFLSHLLGGMSGSTDPNSNGGFADLFNVAKLLQTAAAMGESAFQILSIRNNTPVNTGLLPSGRSNYGLTSVNTTLSATQSASLIATMRVEQDIALGVVSWLGCGTSGITAFYVNIWKLDGVSGDWALVHHSPNILSELTAGTTPNWTFYQLDTPVDQKAGETYAYELVPVGGTHSVRGISTTDDIPDHPFAQVVGLAATRDNSSSPNTPPSTIAKSSVVRSGNIPWIETAIDTGNGVGYYDPISVYVVDSGTIPIPSWANFVDVTAVGGAGGAQQGLTLGFHGESGSPGLYKSTTWQRGVHFADDAVLTFTKGVGGLGGQGDGADGTASIWSIPDYSITAEPGVGGTELQLGANPIGRGPGNFEYKGENHVGGADQKVPGRDGVSPGGGGNGGNGLTFQFGGNGADGAGWVRFRQNPLEGESVIGGPGQVLVPSIESTASLGTPTVSGGLSLLPLEDQAAIDAIVAANMTAPGGVLAIQSPDGYYTKAYGKVSTAAGARNVILEDHFRIGSCTKSFTATMILQAVDRGLLSLDDPLEKFLPGVPGGTKITVRHMMCLRSGLFNEQTDLGMMMRYFLMPTSDWTDEETLAIVKQHEPSFEPGQGWAYVNSNYFLLGMIVSIVNGRPTRDVLQTDILDPLGLTQTSWPTTAKMPEPYANGHAWATGIFGGGAWQDATETGPGYASAAGVMISTAHDLLLWAKELRDGTLLSPELHELRTKCYWPVPWGNDDQLTYFGYGHGMFELGQWRGHGGSWRGYEVSVYYLPNGTLFAMCENAQTPTVEVEVSMMFKIGKYLYPDSLTVPDYQANRVFGIPSKASVGKPIVGSIDVKFDNKSTVGTSQATIPEFTLDPEANIVFAYMATQSGIDMSGVTAKIGGVTMNKLPVISNGSNRLVVWWLLDPPTGARSINLIGTPYGSNYATGAASYKLAAPAGIETPVITQGYSASPSVSASTNSHGRIVNAFLYGGQTSAYNQTERGHLDAVAFGAGLIFGDAPGGSVTFTQTLTAAAPWIGIAIPIVSNAE
ncbi:serine hydrolase [Mycobacteroides abscessus]|uniref:serine hydrolase n=1 Tax=Mycobacteroides abscessus TaxID=36809 RepID=UPI000D9E6BE2|nr:serine hydrolase [Mycobacteroides abscessus]SPX87711.1 Bacteriophage protein [Mycobacteroides abscessus]